MMFFILTLLFVLTAIYQHLKYVYSHWHRMGFPFLKPSIPSGNLGLVTSRKSSFGINIYELYKASTKPFVGIYLLFRPAILLRDAHLIKRVLTIDFNSFHDRGVYCNPVHDPLSENLFAMPGQRWKNLRAKLTPTFTTGRLRSMLPTIMDEGERLQNYLAPLAERNDVVEMKDLLSRYALNVIASVGFGMDVDTIENPNHIFREIEKQINNSNLVNVVRNFAFFLCPKVLEFFHLSSLSAPVQEFMINVVKRNIELREKNNIVRKDFIQFLIQLRNTGKINADDSLWDVKTSSDILKTMSIEQCAAQVFIFYIAGFDTSASTIAYCLYEFAQNPKIMTQIQQEITDTLGKYDGELTYECIQEMNYMELCILETVRKYPTLPILNRECTIDYNIPDTDLTIKKGTAIIISLLGLSRDANYFPDPEQYIPERFLDLKTVNSPAFIPFGDGPRACIGLRMGKLTAKIGLVKILQKYNFTSVDNKPIEFDTHSSTLTPKEGIKLKISQRNVT